ncbi:MAG: helix-turn-helix domain-containing protein [Tannerellaceae bacterium]|jgi:transposase|nr:helix-turn-helix domain-containing protein [Tannerellaceae bacterium]
MLTKMNLSEEEIRVLNYERFQYPCSKVQKKLHAIYLKAAHGYSNTETGKILDIHPNSVAGYIKIYEENGIEGLYRTCYHRNGSPLEVYKDSIIEDFKKQPVCSIAEAISRIKALTGIERKPTLIRAFLHKHGFNCRISKKRR